LKRNSKIRDIMRKAFKEATAKEDFEGCFEVHKERNIYNFYMQVPTTDDDKTKTASGTATHELCPNEVAQTTSGGQQPGFPRQGLRP